MGRDMVRRHSGILFGLLVLLLASLACVTEAAVAPAPAIQPIPVAIELPPIVAPAEVSLPLTIPLPDVHAEVQTRPHAVERHGEDAETARRATVDRRNGCQYYVCSSSRSANNLLRMCDMYDDPEHYVVQWDYFDNELGDWVEGTSHLIRAGKVNAFLFNHGCNAVD